MELSVAPSSAHCAATAVSSSFSKLCFNFRSRSRMLNKCSRKLPSCVVVLCTFDLLSCATLLCFSGRRCGRVLLALQIHATSSDRMASSSCGVPSILFTAFQRLALSFRATARWCCAFFQDVRSGEADVEPPSRRVRSGMRVLRKPLCYARSSSAQNTI